MKLLSRLGSPLLARELIEMSARRRTYITRVLYGILFYAAVWIQFSHLFERIRTQPFALLGHGREIFSYYVWLQFLGILIFMPALTCGAIAYEKERNSLQLLLLTKLGPWSIILEKLASRLVPMFTCQLLGVPLLALTYSLGGIDALHMWFTIWLLFLFSVAIGSLSLACSAYSRTTTGAFISTYFSMGAIFAVSACTCLPVLRMGNGMGGQWSEGVFLSIILIGLSAFLLAIARVSLIARAFVPPRNLLLEFFHGLDSMFQQMNHLTGGIVIVNDDKALPNNEPIAWRETMKKSLGTVRYLFRVLITLETPLLVVLVLSATELRRGSDFSTASKMLYITWVISLLMIAMKGTGLISSERSRETLDVLLTTPLSGDRILVEKFRALRRLLTVLAIPLLTCHFFEAYWESAVPRSYNQAPPMLHYLVPSVLSVFVYLSLAGWIAFWIGLRVRSQTRATVICLALFMGWIFFPLLLPGNRYRATTSRSLPTSGYMDASELRLLFSPQTMITKNEQRDFPGWGWIVVHFSLLGGFALLVRHVCLSNADRYLGRGSPGFGGRLNWTPEPPSVNLSPAADADAP